MKFVGKVLLSCRPLMCGQFMSLPSALKEHNVTGMTQSKRFSSVLVTTDQLSFPLITSGPAGLLVLSQIS